VFPDLRRGGSAHSSTRCSACCSAHSSALFGDRRALGGGCRPRLLGPRLLGPCLLGLRTLLRLRSLRPFNDGSRRRNRTLGMQRGWYLGGVAEVEPDVYAHHHDKQTKHSDRRVEDVEELTRCRPPPSMADPYSLSINAATVASMRGRSWSLTNLRNLGAYAREDSGSCAGS
jgi:hypothetical protein